MPTISIITPVYKTEPYLRRCIESILAQTYEDFELILVDDGSPDRCGAICDEYVRLDRRVRVIHKENGGASSARNAALDIAAGTYISFVDSDDFIHPRMLELLLDALVMSDAGYAACGVKKTDGMDSRYPDVGALKYEVYTADVVFAEYNRVFYPKLTAFLYNKLYRKEVFDGIRFDPTMKIYEDEMVCLELIEAAQRIVYIPCELYNYYQSAESLMRCKANERLFLTFGSLQHMIDFMKSRHITQEVFILEWKWARAYLSLYYLLQKQNPELMGGFRKYQTCFRSKYAELLQNPEVTRAYRVCLRLFRIGPWLAKPLYRYLEQ